jgi:hypothetical protein
VSVVSLQPRYKRPFADRLARADRDRALRAEQAKTREAELAARYWTRAYEDLRAAVVRWHDCPYCGVLTLDPTCPEHRDLVAVDPQVFTSIAEQVR